MRSQAFGTVGSTIRLASGRYLDVLDPQHDDILLTDIFADAQDAFWRWRELRMAR